MKTWFWIFSTEFMQSRFQFLILMGVSLLLGFSANLSYQATKKIESLVTLQDWGADMVILPKGISLETFRNELMEASTIQFLPESMFDSTLSMTNGKIRIKMRAVLALTDERGARILTKGNSDGNLGLQWLGKRIRIENWEEQNHYHTPEWGNKLISGFFASGDLQDLYRLKELVDRRTVGQALIIFDEQAQGRQLRAIDGYIENICSDFIFTGKCMSSFSQYFLKNKIGEYTRCVG